MTDTQRIPGLATLIAEHQRDNTPPTEAAADIIAFFAKWALEQEQVERAAAGIMKTPKETSLEPALAEIRAWKAAPHGMDLYQPLMDEARAAIAALFKVRP